MSTLPDRARHALAGVIDPELRRPITELGMVDEIAELDDGNLRVRLLLTVAHCPAANRIEADARQALERVVAAGDYELTVGVMTPEQREELVRSIRGDRPRDHPFGAGSLTRVICVASGKGGVGKSTVTVNLAAQMAADGLSVGIIDADVHGFSVPALMGLTGDRSSSETGSSVPTRVGGLILPPVAHGVRVISIGMFLGDDEESGGVVAWRGPMLHRTLEQFLRDVHFGDLDALLIDLPPGTGDIAISVGQLVPNAEVVVVTTPQPAAAEVSWRAGALARKTGQRVIGVIETLSPAELVGGQQMALFGEGGGREVAARLAAYGDEDIPVLAEVPISEQLRADGDAGVPHVLAHPDDPAAKRLREAARAIANRPMNLSGRRLGLSVQR